MKTFPILRTGSLALTLLIGGLVGCGDDVGSGGDDIPATNEGPGDVGNEALTASDEDEDGDVYTYNPIGKRDPFRSFISGPREDDIRSPTPLQRWDIDQFLLVGIVWGVDQPKAMVQDPENQSHVLEIGTYIGRNWGKVTQVTSDSVVITEEYQTIEGELVTEQVSLSLPVEEVQE